jgi:glycosyltransferase involved in cell wall biosynthesis
MLYSAGLPDELYAFHVNFLAVRMPQKQIRILYTQAPPGGGSVTGLHELVRGLDRNRYEPIVLFYSKSFYGKQFEALGVKVLTLSGQPRALRWADSNHNLPLSMRRYGKLLNGGSQIVKPVYQVARRDWHLARQIAVIIKHESINLVHHNNNVSVNRAAVIGARLARVPQTCHVRWFNHLSWVDRYLARSIDAFIYMSKAVQECYRNQGIPASRGEVIDDPIDANAHIPINPAAKVRAEFFVSDHEHLVTNVGRLTEWKGQDYFLRAMAEVKRALPDTKALIVGGTDSTPRDQAYCQRLHKLATELDLQECIRFTGFRSDVSEIMAASDIIVHSSSEPEPFGRVIIEAMAAGRPVIATAAGGVPEIIEDRVNGILVPPRNPSLMAAAIQELLRHPEQAKQIAERASRYVREHFSPERHVKAVQSVYQKVLAE